MTVGSVGASVAYTCFFLSGGASLVYQVVWARQLGLIFGHTAYALATILTAFMAGLALGAFFFGRSIDRRGRPLQVYGILEVGIGLSAALVPAAFALVQAAYPFLFQRLAPLPLALVQFATTALLILVPTTLMGATMPVMAKFFTERLEVLGRRIGGLYALNTLGAVAGTVAAGFILLPAIGVRATLLVAVALNLAVGAAAIGADRALRRRETIPSSAPMVAPTAPTEPAPANPVGETLPTRLLLLAVLIGIGLSGAASMIYELAWARALSLVVGSSTYAFSAMLTTFLTGLVLGSFLFARLFGARPISPALFGLLELAIGLSSLLLAPAFNRMPDLFLAIFGLARASPGAALLGQFTISFLIMILPTTLIGATFPCAVQLSTESLRRLGHRVGRAYSANTLGTVLGAFAAGFFLVPAVGLHGSIAVAAALNLTVGGAVLLLTAPPGLRWALALSAGVAVAAWTWLPGWERSILVSGVAIYGPRFLQQGDASARLRAEAAARRLLFYREGINSTVSVEQTAEITSLRVGGKADASNGVDMLTQLMLGHLPPLLHPGAERVLVVGLGSGVTVGAVAQHPVREIDVVELEPAVVEASAFFARENRNALRDPRVRVTIADGRNFLLGTAERYDVITSEPSNPWMAGVANLFSREFYDLAARRLLPGGLMVQWIHGYSLFPRELKMVVKTFRGVFPHTTVWWTIRGDYLLVGGRQRMAPDLRAMAARVAASSGLRQDLAMLAAMPRDSSGEASPPPITLLSLFLLNEEEAARFAEGTPENTDDRPLLEFSAPLALYANTISENHRLLKAARTRSPRLLADLDPTSRLALARAYWARGEAEEAADQLRRMGAGADDPATRLERAKLLFALGEMEEATRDLEAITALRGASAEGELVRSYIQAARALTGAGIARAVFQHAEGVGHIWNPARAHNRLGIFNVSAGIRFKEIALFDVAVDAFQAALRIEPENLAILNNLANAYFEKRMYQEALLAYARVLERKADLPGTHYNMGMTYQALGRWEAAEQAFRKALELQPDWELPRQKLLETAKQQPAGTRSQGR